MPMDDLQAVTLACMAAALTLYAIRWYTNPLSTIPTVGGSSFSGLSYLRLAVRYTPPDFKELLKEGYRKYPESAFKIAHHLDQWVVVVSGRRMVEELRKRPDEELSAQLGQEELLQTQYSFEAPLLSDQYHTQILKEKLTRILPDILSDVVDEIAVAVREYIGATENEWTSIHAMPAMRNIVARASNRAFVGLPLCRNRDYLAQAIGFALHVSKDARVFRRVPSFMKPLVALFVRNVRHHTDLAVPHVRPIIEERMKAWAELGEGWNDKPNDMLQFILDRAIPKGESLTIIVQRLLVLNFAAIATSTNRNPFHNSPQTVTHVLYHLAEKPDLLVPLREEVEASIAAEGWTAAALGRMWKLDSVLRETLRHHDINFLGMHRKAMKDITLSDGTRIPRGTMVAAARHPMHHDDAVLENADAFDPFRYARMRMAAADDGLRHQFTSTSPEYISFGHGPHACPGRYFAANELKAILAHIILEYDLKLGGDGARPADVCYGMNVAPAPDGCVLFKKREASA